MFLSHSRFHQFPSKLPSLDAFDGEDEEDEPKMKKLDEFLKEEPSPSEQEIEEMKEKPVEEEKKAEDEEKKAEDEELKEETDEQVDSGKVYSVFLPPELKQSLESGADDDANVWDIERVNKMAAEAQATQTPNEPSEK